MYGTEATRWFGAARRRVKCLPPSREMCDVMAQFSHSGWLQRVDAVVFRAWNSLCVKATTVSLGKIQGEYIHSRDAHMEGTQHSGTRQSALLPQLLS